MFVRQRRRVRGGEAPVVLTPAGSTLLPSAPFVPNPQPAFYRLGTFVGQGQTVAIDTNATVQIVTGYGGCRDDKVDARLAVVDNMTFAMVTSGPTVYIDRRAKICGAAKTRSKRSLQDTTEIRTIPFNLPDNTFVAEAGRTYSVGFWYVNDTDDRTQFTWSDVVLSVIGTTLVTLPANAVNLGNRVVPDGAKNYYVAVGGFWSPTGNLVHLTGNGVIAIGGGSGKDRLTAQVVVKEGKDFTGNTAGSLRTVYAGPLSQVATRSYDQPFEFSSSIAEFVPIHPGYAYTVFVQLNVMTDDTIRVNWSNVIVTLVA